MPESKFIWLVPCRCGWIFRLVFHRCGRIFGFTFEFLSDPLVFSSADILVYVERIFPFFLRRCGWQNTFAPDHCLNVSFPARRTFGFYVEAFLYFLLRCCGRCLHLASTVVDESVVWFSIFFPIHLFLPRLNFGCIGTFYCFCLPPFRKEKFFLFRSAL